MPSAFRRSTGGSNKTRIAPISESSSGPPNRLPAVKPATVRPLRGVKPWQGGCYLTSVGLNDLDSILGGGQIVGTSIVIEEDRLWTRDLAITLVKYWCAEVRDVMALFVGMLPACVILEPIFIHLASCETSLLFLGHIPRSSLGRSTVFEQFPRGRK